jgi:hypothetical protein
MLQAPDEWHEALSPLHQQVPHLHREGQDDLDLVEHHPFGRRVQAVGDVVHGVGQGHDVLPLDGRDEGAVQLVQHVVGVLVSPVLQVLELLAHLGQAGRIRVPESPGEQACRRGQVFRGAFQQVEEDHFAGSEPAGEGVQGHGFSEPGHCPSGLILA